MGEKCGDKENNILLHFVVEKSCFKLLINFLGLGIEQNNLFVVFLLLPIKKSIKLFLHPLTLLTFNSHIMFSFEVFFFFYPSCLVKSNKCHQLETVAS